MVLPTPRPTKSYWIEAAESPLRNHRSTDKLPEEVDIVVVGSGYTGAASAYWLDRFTENGTRPSILVLEARGICEGATGRNGGLLRPHYFSRYTTWRSRFGPAEARKVIEHEAAHLDAFTKLVEEEEDIAAETAFSITETFDAAMHQEAVDHLFQAVDQLREDHPDAEILKCIRKIEDPKEAEEATQIKGALGAVFQRSGQIWPYKFVHALHRRNIRRDINLQANTPVESISDRDESGRIILTTPRGNVRAKAVIHATNRWASHLVPEFERLIYPGRASLAAVKSPQGFLKHTGATHFDHQVNNYFCPLPPPYNVIIIGGAKQLTSHTPEIFVNNNEEDKQMPGAREFYSTWAERELKDWPFTGDGHSDFDRPDDQGGIWTGVYGNSADMFPFVGAIPGKQGQFIAAGFTGHGMPRILGSTAHLAPIVLEFLRQETTIPDLAKIFPPLPSPFHITEDRVRKLQGNSVEEYAQPILDSWRESAKKDICAPFKPKDLDRSFSPAADQHRNIKV